VADGCDNDKAVCVDEFVVVSYVLQDIQEDGRIGTGIGSLVPYAYRCGIPDVVASEVSTLNDCYYAMNLLLLSS